MRSTDGASPGLTNETAGEVSKHYEHRTRIPGRRNLCDSNRLLFRVREESTGRGVGHPKFIGQHEESWVRSPHLESTDQRGCQNVHVDPSNTSPEKSSFTNKLNNLLVGDRLSLVHLCVRFEKVPSATSNFANEQFAENHFVSNCLVPTKNLVKATGEWLTPGEEPDPDRSIH